MRAPPVERAFVDRDSNNVSPRFGFAYDLTGDGKTAIRGGYGIIYMYTDSGDTNGDNSNALGHEAITPFVAPTGGPYKAFQFSAGPATILQPDGANGGPAAYRGQAMRYQDRNAPTPYLQQWNLTLQRELIRGWVASVSYAGNKGTKLFGGNYNLNQLDPAYWIAAARAAGPGAESVLRPDHLGRGGRSDGATVAASAALSRLRLHQPDERARFVEQLPLHAGDGREALLAGLERARSPSQAASSSTTRFPRPASNGGRRRLPHRAVQPQARPLPRHRRRGAAHGHQRRLRTAFRQGQEIWRERERFLNQVIGGWQVNTMTTVQGGLPLQVRGANNFTGINWPNVTGRRLPVFGPERSIDRWFNTARIPEPAPTGRSATLPALCPTCADPESSTSPSRCSRPSSSRRE